jgi:outer membrane protein assembly factor BamD (BamD/ComL family)
MENVRVLVLLAILLLLAACGLSASVSEESDPYRSDGETYSRSVSFGGQDRFEEAQELVMARDFSGAIAIYRNLYQTSPDNEVKARALLEWAHAEHSPFNPDRDPGAAEARLQLLLEDYPDSEVAPEAADDLAAMGN